MRLLFAAVRFYPWWALPTMLLCLELGQIFSRKGKRVRFVYWGFSLFFLVTTVLWFMFGGQNRSDHWVRSMFGG